MKIVNIIGGLGNQMFQYAFLTALKTRYPDEKIVMNLREFNGYHLHNGFELDRLFNITAGVASSYDMIKLSYFAPTYKLQRLVRKLLSIRKSEFIEGISGTNEADNIYTDKSMYYEGYWQTRKYFEEYKKEIIKQFSWKKTLDIHNEMFIQKLNNIKKTTISIHVRRGDYLKDSVWQGICDLDYYSKAINVVLNKYKEVHFVLFSNDINWCKENVVPLLNNSTFSIVDWNNGKDSYKDMQLMSLCKANIIANSSFSCWGAYLNLHEDSFVIAPKKWANGTLNTKPQLIEWFLI